MIQGQDLAPLLDVHLVLQEGHGVEYQKAVTSGKRLGNVVGYFL